MKMDPLVSEQEDISEDEDEIDSSEEENSEEDDEEIENSEEDEEETDCSEEDEEEIDCSEEEKEENEQSTEQEESDEEIVGQVSNARNEGGGESSKFRRLKAKIFNLAWKKMIGKRQQRNGRFSARRILNHLILVYAHTSLSINYFTLKTRRMVQWQLLEANV